MQSPLVLLTWVYNQKEIGDRVRVCALYGRRRPRRHRFFSGMRVLIYAYTHHQPLAFVIISLLFAFQRRWHVLLQTYNKRFFSSIISHGLSLLVTCRETGSWDMMYASRTAAGSLALHRLHISSTIRFRNTDTVVR